MSWRQAEFADYGNQVVWLNRTDAASAYAEAINCSSQCHYGLNQKTIVGIERLDVNLDPSKATHWLSERCRPPHGEVRLIFGPSDVCAIPIGLFIENWQDMMMPSRDDVVILPAVGKWVLYYCHEDVFEFGHRIENAGAP